MATLLEEHAREKAGMSENWRVYRFECFPKNGEKILYFELTGAVVPFYTRGEKKGKPNWSREDITTKHVVVLPVDEHDEWTRKWEQKTGKCANCQGSGKELEGCGIHGTTYRCCRKCHGEGLTKVL